MVKLYTLRKYLDSKFVAGAFGRYEIGLEDLIVVSPLPLTIRILKNPRIRLSLKVSPTDINNPTFYSRENIKPCYVVALLARLLF